MAISVSTDRLVLAMRWMLLSRALDNLLVKLQRIGRVGLYGPAEGQEATLVGSALALDPAIDWMVPASREQPAWLIHGLPLENLLAMYMGRLEQARIPEDVRLLPRQQAIGAQLPHAVGLAWAMKLREQPSVVLVYFGEGASSEGDFHEAANLAGVQQVPLVFVLVNNQYAISTPVAKQSAARDLSLRAAGYGFPGLSVDGNDFQAVFSATLEAVARARAGGGPTLIEAQTYRMSFHNTSDNPREYRGDDEVREAGLRDPIVRLRRELTEAEAWSEEIEIEMQHEIQANVMAAYEKVAAMPKPGPSAIFEHVYAELPDRVQQQRRKRLG